MLFIFLVLFIYKITFKKKQTLEQRSNLPKICVFINNDNYTDILRILSLQTYPKDMFDVYIKTNETFNYKFNVYQFSNQAVRNINYDLISIIDNIVDLNYLNFTAKDYMLGYDIIVGTTYYNTSLLLVKRTINSLFENYITNNCFSFDFLLFKNNIININNIPLLKKFLISKTNLIKINKDVKVLENNVYYDDNILLINPLTKRNFYFKLYLITVFIFIIIFNNNLINLILIIYLLLFLSNLYFLYKNHTIKVIPILLLPFNIIIYFINFLFFRINNKRSYIKSI